MIKRRSSLHGYSRSCNNYYTLTRLSCIFTIREFFAAENPYDDLLNVLTESQPLLEFPEGRGIKRKEKPLIKTLFLTLSEVVSFVLTLHS